MGNDSGWYTLADGTAVHVHGHNIDEAALQQIARFVAEAQREEAARRESAAPEAEASLEDDEHTDAPTSAG